MTDLMDYIMRIIIIFTFLEVLIFQPKRPVGGDVPANDLFDGDVNFDVVDFFQSSNEWRKFCSCSNLQLLIFGNTALMKKTSNTLAVLRSTHIGKLFHLKREILVLLPLKILTDDRP